MKSEILVEVVILMETGIQFFEGLYISGFPPMRE